MADPFWRWSEPCFYLQTLSHWRFCLIKITGNPLPIPTMVWTVCPGVLLYKDQWLTLSEDEVNPAFIYKPWGTEGFALWRSLATPYWTEHCFDLQTLSHWRLCCALASTNELQVGDSDELPQCGTTTGQNNGCGTDKAYQQNFTYQLLSLTKHLALILTEINVVNTTLQATNLILATKQLLLLESSSSSSSSSERIGSEDPTDPAGTIW